MELSESHDYWKEGLDLIDKLWNTDYGTVERGHIGKHKEEIVLTTGGWSENEQEIIKILTDEDMYWNYPEKQVLEATRELLNLYNQEKEKNKKLEETINNLAKAVKFMGTNEELTIEDIIKMFSPEEIKIDFDDFMKRWENEQHKKAKQKLQKEKEKNKKLEDEAILLRKTHDYDVKMIDEVKGEYNKLFKELQHEKEKNKKLEKEKEAFMRGYSEAREDEANTFMNSYKQKQIYEKVIDLMAEEITDFTGSCPADIFDKEWDEEEGDCEHCKSTDKECFIKYYFKKARGEENEQI